MPHQTPVLTVCLGISSEVADSDHAIILDQVENGVAIRMAIIYLLASKLNIPIA